MAFFYIKSKFGWSVKTRNQVLTYESFHKNFFKYSFPKILSDGESFIFNRSTEHGLIMSGSDEDLKMLKTIIKKLYI